MDNLVLDAVEAELKAIENKYTPSPRIKNCKSELVQPLLKLYEELNTIGVAKFKLKSNLSESGILEKLIDDTFVLIQFYRKSLKEVNNECTSKISLNTQNLKLNEALANYENEIEMKNKQIAGLNEQIRRLQYQFRDSEKLNKELKKKLSLMESYFHSKENEHLHTIERLEQLQQKREQSPGKCVSNSLVIADAIKQFKIKEKMYKETILNLQNNNKQLMEEVLDLKHEIVVNNCNRNQE